MLKWLVKIGVESIILRNPSLHSAVGSIHKIKLISHPEIIMLKCNLEV